jgi:hypothetical protein
MGKKDVSTETKLDPMAEKARNIGYNANLAAYGYGSTGNYNKAGVPNTGAPMPNTGQPAIPSSAGGAMPGSVSVGQYPGAPMVNSMAPGGAPPPNGMLQLSGAGMNANGAPQPAYQQDWVPGAGSSVAGYDQGFGDAYGGTGRTADAASAASQGGYDAAGRFLDPAKAAADAQARMNPWMSGVDQAMTGKYEESLAMAQRAARGSAVSAGAYGGTRAGVAAGEATRGATLDYMSQQAQMRNEAYYAAQGQTERAGQLGANLGMGGGQLAGDMYRNQGAFSEQVRQLQQDKYDARFKDLGMLTDALNGGTSGTTVVERGGGGFFG